MLTLGLNIAGSGASAALVEDDMILAASSEEQFSHIKGDRNFPVSAIRDVLTRSGVDLADVDTVAVGCNPAKNLSVNLDTLREAARQQPLHVLAYVPAGLAVAFGAEPQSEISQEVLDRRIVYIDHALAHAASACLTGPWERCAFATIDSGIEPDALTIGYLRHNHLEVLERLRFPHSLGVFYGYIAEFLGFRADADEAKLMTLSGYGDPDFGQGLVDKFGRTYQLSVHEGRLHFALDQSFIEPWPTSRLLHFAPLASLLDIAPRRPEDPIEPVHCALAWAAQRTYETILTEILKYAQARTGEANISLAGGCALNAVANARMRAPQGPFEGVHIPPYPDDRGTAIGAALFVNLRNSSHPHRHYRQTFFGHEVTAGDAENALRHRKLPIKEVADVAAMTAHRIADGEIVGFVAGGQEFGGQALGHRSILADPRDPQIRTKLNDRVKSGEWFRPYAASILAEYVSEICDVSADFRSDFMEQVQPVRPSWAPHIPGVTHADGTIRLHTVERRTNPDLYEILQAFHRITDVPLLLHTSLNLGGQPIVRDASDALQCFFATGLDSLFLAGFWLRKEGVVEAEEPDVVAIA